MEKKEWGLSGGALKIIALVTMILDHATAVFVNYYEQTALYNAGRCIGRLSFPIYCFLLVEGFCYTRNVKKYSLRLFLFALVSEMPFDLAFFGCIYWGHQNVFFTLFLGLLAIWITDTAIKKCSNLAAGKVMCCAGLIVIYFACYFVRADYGFYGVCLIFLFYVFRAQKEKVAASNVVINGIMALGGNRQIFGGFSSILIAFYNGEKGISLKYFFYAIYPIHLLLFYWLKYYIF